MLGWMRLGVEALEDLVLLHELLVQELDRSLPFAAGAVGLVDRAHAALAQEAKEAPAAVENSADELTGRTGIAHAAHSTKKRAIRPAPRVARGVRLGSAYKSSPSAPSKAALVARID